MTDENTLLASVWKRILANIFDNILVSLFTSLIMLTLTFAIFDELLLQNLPAFLTVPVTAQYGLGSVGLSLGQLFFAVYFVLFFIFFNLVYTQTLLMSHHQATFGMRIFNIRLEKIDGSKPSFNVVFFRNILFALLRLVYLGIISLFTIIFHHHKQGLHDMVFGTVVTDNTHGDTN